MSKTYCSKCKSLGYVWVIRHKPAENSNVIGRVLAITSVAGHYRPLQSNVRLRMECLDCGGFGVIEV